MSAKQQAACDLIKTRLAYNAHLQKGKKMELHDTSQTESVQRTENDTHDVKGTET